MFPKAALVLVRASHLQLNSLLQVLVRLLDQLFSPQHSVPHHVLRATAAGGDGRKKPVAVYDVVTSLINAIFSFHPLLVANMTELSALCSVCCRNAPLESSASPEILCPQSFVFFNQKTRYCLMQLLICCTDESKRRVSCPSKL